MGWNSLQITHDLMTRYVRPGDLCIDATAGKGRDTVLLAKLTGPAGKVHALDIQPAALEATRRLAEKEGVSGQVETHLLTHARIRELTAPGTVACIAFNLGWLPGGDHTLHTKKDTTLQALEQSLDLLRPGGVLSLCIYYGKENGYEERDAILAWLEGLDDKQYNVLILTFPNRKNDPPIPVFIRKEGERTPGPFAGRERDGGRSL